MQRPEHIFVFKTNIQCEADRRRLQPYLDGHQHIEQWTVDLDDEDCVLRIISQTLNHKKIIELISLHGFECSELI